MTRAKDIMTTELILGHPGMTVEDAIKVIYNNRITGMPVVDEAHHVVGVVSEYDVIKAVEEYDQEKPLPLGELIKYSTKVTKITEETALPEILKYFVEKKVRRLPVVNKQEELVGIITRRDIMRVLFYRSKVL